MRLLKDLVLLLRPSITDLMYESKIQPLHTFVLGANYVLVLLLLGHRVPLLISDLIAPDIERLDDEEQRDVDAANSEQDLVTPAVQWLVVFAVDVRRDDVPRLHEHIVEGGGHGARADRVGVCRVPPDEDGVAVWIRK